MFSVLIEIEPFSLVIGLNFYSFLSVNGSAIAVPNGLELTDWHFA
jgi:hypothetical protein